MNVKASLKWVSDYITVIEKADSSCEQKLILPELWKVKSILKALEVENQKHTKPCRVDGKTPCVQYPDDNCDCDPCEYCEIAIVYKRLKE